MMRLLWPCFVFTLWSLIPSPVNGAFVWNNLGYFPPPFGISIAYLDNWGNDVFQGYALDNSITSHKQTISFNGKRGYANLTVDVQYNPTTEAKSIQWDLEMNTYEGSARIEWHYPFFMTEVTDQEVFVFNRQLSHSSTGRVFTHDYLGRGHWYNYRYFDNISVYSQDQNIPIVPVDSGNLIYDNYGYDFYGLFTIDTYTGQQGHYSASFRFTAKPLVDPPNASVPEPGTMALVVTGVLAGIIHMATQRWVGTLPSNQTQSSEKEEPR